MHSRMNGRLHIPARGLGCRQSFFAPGKPHTGHFLGACQKSEHDVPTDGCPLAAYRERRPDQICAGCRVSVLVLGAEYVVDDR